MNFEKFHGPTVKEARQRADKKLGKTYTVVETHKADNGESAWINVLNEERQRQSGTYSRGDLFPKVLKQLKKTLNESFSLFDVNDQTNSSRPSPQKPARQTYDISDIRGAKDTALKKASFESKDRRPKTDNELSPGNKQSEPLKTETQSLEQRFKKLERLVSAQMAESKHNYTYHPAFQQLLESGVPRDTITTWFDELVNDNVNLYDEQGNFQQMLADKVKTMLDVAADDELSKVMLFTGSSSAGKSSLIMKLALRLTLQQEAKCALVSVYPVKGGNYYSPIEDFVSEHNLVHSIVQDIKSLHSLKENWEQFDHIFIEMLPEKRQQKSSISTEDFKEFFAVQNSFSFEVHHVINAMLNPACLNNQSYFGDQSVRRYLDFTHLDETHLRGHLLPIMDQFGCKVRYITNGPLIPEDISEFEPEHFAMQLLAKK